MKTRDWVAIWHPGSRRVSHFTYMTEKFLCVAQRTPGRRNRHNVFVLPVDGVLPFCIAVNISLAASARAVATCLAAITGPEWEDAYLGHLARMEQGRQVLTRLILEGRKAANRTRSE